MAHNNKRRYYTKNQINEAIKDARSYEIFKENLKEQGLEVPESVAKFPMGMVNWYRKLRYEMSQDYRFGKHPTAHDMRQKRYYERLEKLGHPNPEKIM